MSDLKSNEFSIVLHLLKQSQIKTGQIKLELHREQDDTKKQTLHWKLKELQADEVSRYLKKNDALEEYVKAKEDFQNAEKFE